MKTNFAFPVQLASYNNLRGWMYLAYTAHQADKVWDLATEMGMCQLNSAIDIRDLFFTAIKLSDKGKSRIAVSFPDIIPVKHFKAPPRTKKVNVKLVAANSSFDAWGLAPLTSAKQISFDYNKTLVPAQDIQIDLQAKAGDIVIVATAIEYETTGSDRPVLDPRWLPGAVIGMGRLKK